MEEAMVDTEKNPNNLSSQFRVCLHLRVHAIIGTIVEEIQEHGPFSNFIFKLERVSLYKIIFDKARINSRAGDSVLLHQILCLAQSHVECGHFKLIVERNTGQRQGHGHRPGKIVESCDSVDLRIQPDPEGEQAAVPVPDPEHDVEPSNQAITAG